MFNTISRQKLRQIIATDFPELSPFADMLYEHKVERKFAKRIDLGMILRYVKALPKDALYCQPLLS